MGNCQAIDAATLVIQHPNGRAERLYCPVSANEVMRTNPGHFIALVLSLSPSEEELRWNNGVHSTRVKLLRPCDTLVLGQAYRLITSKEVMKALSDKKHVKMMKNHKEWIEEKSCSTSEKTNQIQAKRDERHHPKTRSTRFRPWNPSLQSISEAEADNITSRSRPK